ncbi:MAG TPA: hypothetical protein GX717_06320 [Clostridiaceae bacterium]|nr:hypothetical protein [Clostridiaceae bacterium]
MDNLVNALDWQADLHLNAPLTPETDYIGVRSHYIQLSLEETANSIKVRPVLVIENLFETSVLCRPLTANRGIGQEGNIQVDMQPEIWEKYKNRKQFWLKIDPDVIMPLQS